MADLMKLRLRGDGPEAWKFRIEDVETGKLLTITATLMVSEVEIEGLISIPDLIRQVTSESETVDEFTARTVALVLDGNP